MAGNRSAAGDRAGVAAKVGDAENALSGRAGSENRHAEERDLVSAYDSLEHVRGNWQGSRVESTNLRIPCASGIGVTCNRNARSATGATSAYCPNFLPTPCNPRPGYCKAVALALGHNRQDPEPGSSIKSNASEALATALVPSKRLVTWVFTNTVTLAKRNLCAGYRVCATRTNNNNVAERFSRTLATGLRRYRRICGRAGKRCSTASAADLCTGETRK